MKVYLVGGAVRDKLLGISNSDKDYVVVGSTTKEMIALGYTQVGKSFPVFLHPQTKEEYALARRETKVSKGHLGFNTDITNVSLKEDLMRRDLTINSMAMDEVGSVIDYCDGAKDLQHGILRHTSPAFIEDPLRILRIARFGAQFKGLNFKVAPSTHKLMCSMVEQGELNTLPSERIFTELKKSLESYHSSEFFNILSSCGAYSALFGVNDSINTSKNAFTHLDNNEPAIIKFALWLYNYDLTTVSNIAKILKVPKKFNKFTLTVRRTLPIIKEFSALSAKDKLEFYIYIDAFRNIAQLNNVLRVFELLGMDVHTIKALHSKLVNIAFDVNASNGIELLKQQRIKMIHNYVE